MTVADVPVARAVQSGEQSSTQSATIMDKATERGHALIARTHQRWPYQLRLPLAPYRFVWKDDPAIDAAKDATDSYTEERYQHADGTHTVIREYRADGSYHIFSDRGEIELIDNAANPYAPDPVSVVRLPLTLRVPSPGERVACTAADRVSRTRRRAAPPGRHTAPRGPAGPVADLARQMAPRSGYFGRHRGHLVR
jgi:hypothetical protein